MHFQIIGLSALFIQVNALSVILTPKRHFQSFEFALFARSHNLNEIASFDDLSFYKTDIENYNYHKSVFNQMFDVEDDLVYTLPKPVVGEAEHVFVQSPGHTDFAYSFPTPWHLDRISKKHLPLDNVFPYSEHNSCHKNKDVVVHTYIVDTGIDVDHPEFEGRAVWLANFADNKNTDCNNHGTHCAGLVGSKTYGVCKDANLFAVKVLDCQGSGSYSGILAGLDFVYKRHLSQATSVRSVLSMSLGGGFSKAINRAVESLITSDTMYVAVASGNEDADACQTSPASAKGILTVNAMDRYDNRAYFSNYGTCTDIYSPGVDIVSTIPKGKTAVYSGTSMACPQIVGVINHYIDQFPELNMKSLKAKMLQDATKNVIQGNPKQTNNMLVYLHRED